jgi:hypothetical protein
LEAANRACGIGGEAYVTGWPGLCLPGLWRAFDADDDRGAGAA